MNANIAECQKIYELSANLLFNIGQCFFYQQQWRQAVLMYNEALTINPQYGKALYRRALAQYEQ